MQKFTIFTVIFSVIVLTITTELVVQDYLQKLYPPPGSVQASTLGDDDFGVFYNENGEAIGSEGETTPEDDLQDSEEEPRTSKVREILNEQREEDVESTIGVASGGSIRIKTLLPAVNVAGIKFEDSDYPGKLFHLIETSDLEIEEISYGLFKLNSFLYANAYTIWSCWKMTNISLTLTTLFT